MKFATVIFVLCALFGLSLGLKDAVCGHPPAIDGNGLVKCLASRTSFSYYPAENACKSFMYGGCGGNENRFDSEHECLAKCKE
ncbi:male accessory gland serine protease inhibitor-like [Drosophila innubila]|uniref:male accessory gland serine protease inhibitor-like n=1 Tax=Drosophila innubila TaxID=198719 RepID=UPI00148D7305|nr:male accessory gland serine protease inhibitor-like [Drosophila innubila]